jgi:hypothetical protein
MTYKQAGTFVRDLQTTAGMPANLQALSFAASYVRLIPGGAAKLTALLGMMPTKTAKQIEHFYYTRSAVFASMQINNVGGYAAGATTFTVDDTSNLVVGQVLQNFRTSEQVLLTAINSATSVDVVRGYGTTAAAAINDDDFFPVVGNAHEQASLRPTSAVIRPERVFNYTQIFRNAWALSDTHRAIENIAGMGNVAESRLDCMEFHMQDMEKAVLFGERYAGTLNSKPINKMDGIINSIKQYAPANVSTAGATTTFDQLEAMLDPIFDTQSDPKIGTERLLLVGGQALKVINKIGRLSGEYQIVQGQTSFGLQFNEFKLSRGSFKMLEHPLLNTNASWAKMAIAVDLSSLALAYLPGRKTKSEEYGMDGRSTDDGIDAVGGSLTTEMTLEFLNPAANAVVYNLTAAA